MWKALLLFPHFWPKKTFQIRLFFVHFGGFNLAVSAATLKERRLMFFLLVTESPDTRQKLVEGGEENPKVFQNKTYINLLKMENEWVVCFYPCGLEPTVPRTGTGLWPGGCCSFQPYCVFDGLLTVFVVKTSFHASR